MMKFKRGANNPILQEAHKLSWCHRGIRNSGATLDGDTARMLFTANAVLECPQYGKMRFGYAESKGGFNFKYRPDPILEPSDGNMVFGRTGIDDPRITAIDDHLYFAYAAPGPVPDIPTDSHKNEKPMWLLGLRRTGLVRTKDWLNVERVEPISNPLMGDVNAVIFPRKINGKYVMMHRPVMVTTGAFG